MKSRFMSPLQHRQVVGDDISEPKPILTPDSRRQPRLPSSCLQLGRHHPHHPKVLARHFTIEDHCLSLSDANIASALPEVGIAKTF
jgi:hypothetical protein